MIVKNNKILISELHKYGITFQEISSKVECSRTLVSLVLNGRRADRRGIARAALAMLKKAKEEEASINALISELAA